MKNQPVRQILTLCSSLFFLFILVACASPTPATNPTSTPPAEPDVFPRPTITPEPLDTTGGYPAPATPTVELREPGYPMPTVAVIDPYPSVDGFVWVIKPVGQQCEQVEMNVARAESELVAADVEVNIATTVNLPVCAACSCPTSEHYRMQIAAEDLEKAIDLGWTEEQQ